MADQQELKLPNFSEGEDAFWTKISPDIRFALKKMEDAETWVYRSDQLPELFDESARMLPRITKLSDSTVDVVIDDLILIMSIMPFRQSIYGIAWLETYSMNEYGWGLILYERAKENLQRFTPGEVLYDTSHTIYSRVSALSKLNIASQVFCSPMQVFENEKGVEK